MNKKLFAVLLPPAAFSICYIISVLFLKLMDTVHFVCPIRLATGLLCPGCGSTRALSALLNLDFTASLKYNPVILILSAGLILWYFQFFSDTFDLRIRILPRNKTVYIVSGVIIFLYLFSRNFIPALNSGI